VFVFDVVIREREVEGECSSKAGADCTSEGEMVLPRSTDSWAEG